jgi:hypothetical protein
LKTFNKALEKYARCRKIKNEVIQENGDAQPGPSNDIQQFNSTPPKDEDVENAIRIVIDMFPHLGDSEKNRIFLKVVCVIEFFRFCFAVFGGLQLSGKRRHHGHFRRKFATASSKHSI